MTHTSRTGALRWVCTLKKINIMQFEYKDLPDSLRDLRFLRRSKEENFILRVKKNEDGRSVWRIADNIKCEQIETE